MRWFALVSVAFAFACQAPTVTLSRGAGIEVCGEEALSQPITAPLTSQISAVGVANGRVLVLAGALYETDGAGHSLRRLAAPGIDASRSVVVHDGLISIDDTRTPTHFIVDAHAGLDDSVSSAKCPALPTEVRTLKTGGDEVVAQNADGLYASPNGCTGWTRGLIGPSIQAEYSRRAGGWLAYEPSSAGGSLLFASSALGIWTTVATGVGRINALLPLSPTRALVSRESGVETLDWSSGSLTSSPVNVALSEVDSISEASSGGYWLVGSGIAELDATLTVSRIFATGFDADERGAVADLGAYGTWLIGSNGLMIENGELLAPTALAIGAVEPRLSCSGVRSWTRYSLGDWDWALASIREPLPDGRWRVSRAPVLSGGGSYAVGPYWLGSTSVFWGQWYDDAPRVSAVAANTDGTVSTLFTSVGPSSVHFGFVPAAITQALPIPAARGESLRWMFEMPPANAHDDPSTKLFLFDGRALTLLPSPPDAVAQSGMIDPVRPEHLAYFTKGVTGMELRESFDGGKTWALEALVRAARSISMDGDGEVTWLDGDDHVCTRKGCDSEKASSLSTVMDSSGNTALLVVTPTQIEVRTTALAAPTVLSEGGFVRGTWLNLVMISDARGDRIIRL
ncbi:MAG: hypothetical protein ACJ790_04390 [Myxococcaceae bacterium]